MSHFDTLLVTRYRKTAISWFTKAIRLLEWEAIQDTSEPAKVLASYEAEHLLVSMLWEAEALVKLLDPEQVAEVNRRVDSLRSLLRKHRLAHVLADVSGRTPEEAETFRAKAVSL